MKFVQAAQAKTLHCPVRADEVQLGTFVDCSPTGEASPRARTLNEYLEPICQMEIEQAEAKKRVGSRAINAKKVSGDSSSVEVLASYTCTGREGYFTEPDASPPTCFQIKNYSDMCRDLLHDLNFKRHLVEHGREVHLIIGKMQSQGCCVRYTQKDATQCSPFQCNVLCNWTLDSVKENVQVEVNEYREFCYGVQLVKFWVREEDQQAVNESRDAADTLFKMKVENDIAEPKWAMLFEEC